MSEATYETAKRCPKCTEPGEDMGGKPAPGLPPGTKVHLIYCRKEGCEWFNTCWLVQVNPDGSVPQPKDHRGEPKIYMGFEGHDQLARDLKAAVEADKMLQRRPGHEIRRPKDL
jgi:hypothetical protein